MEIKYPKIPTAWVCKLCHQVDFPEVGEPMASPEHIPHRGVDIGSCPGKMVPVYSREDLEAANHIVDGNKKVGEPHEWPKPSEPYDWRRPIHDRHGKAGA